MKTRLLKTSVMYLAAAIFCGIFAVVYESFSHGVYSPYMICAFVFPLVMGCIPFALIDHLYKKKAQRYILPESFSVYTYGFGVAALTVGSIIRGVLDIYGTTNSLSGIYWAAGLILVFIGASLYILKLTLAIAAKYNS